MKCYNCGRELEPNAEICEYCGNRIGGEKKHTNIFGESNMGPIDGSFDMGKVYEVRNKILFFDSNSKAFKIFCYVDLAILAIVLIVSLIAKVMLVPYMAGLAMVALLIYMFANSRKDESNVRFAVGRQIVLLLVVGTAFLIFMTVFMIQFDHNPDFVLTNSLASQLAESSKMVTHENNKGWRIKYNNEKFYCADPFNPDETVISYIGECSGTDALILTYYDEVSPDKVLEEKLSSYEITQLEQGEKKIGYGAYPAKYAYIIPENEDPNAGDVMYSKFYALGHRGGTLLLETIEHLETDEEQSARVKNAMAELMGAIELFEPTK